MSKVDSGNVVPSEAYLAELRDAVEQVRLRRIRREAEANEARGFWKGVCATMAAERDADARLCPWPRGYHALRCEAADLRRWASE